MKLKSFIKKMLNLLLSPFDHLLVRKAELVDFCLHRYASYQDYRNVQIYHNKRKLDSIWADKRTLDRVVEIVNAEFKTKDAIFGICHGTRNGFEQNYLRNASPKFQVIGTDISETAVRYEHSIQWDFHQENPDWKNTKDFIYTNSLDQSWQPTIALQTWLSQLHPAGILIIEHSESHGPKHSSEMDPFGVKPTAMPYVLTMWFGAQISITHSVERKSNNDYNAWLFVIRKNVNDVVLIENEIDF